MVIYVNQPLPQASNFRRGECFTARTRRNPRPYDQFAPVYAHCRWCAGEIFLGQNFYEMEDGKICMDCLPDYARKYFLAALRTALPRPGYDTEGNFR